MPAPLVEQPQQHVERLAGRAADVVEHRDVGREQPARQHFGADELAAARRRFAHDHGVAYQLAQPRVAVELAEEGGELRLRRRRLREQRLRGARRALHVHVLLGDQRQNEALLERALADHRRVEAVAELGTPSGGRQEAKRRATRKFVAPGAVAREARSAGGTERDGSRDALRRRRRPADQQSYGHRVSRQALSLPSLL